MLLKPGRKARLTALAMMGASVCVAAFATQMTPPNATDTSTEQAVNVSPAVLANYVGSYQFGPYSVMTVKLDGAQLSAQLTGQRFIDVYPSSNVAFFVKVVNAHMTFVVDAQGKSTAMEFYQNGHHVTAPRIDTATAQGIQDALKARVSAQQPYPGSEQLLQVVLSQDPDASRLSPELAEVMRGQKPRTDALVARLGPATSHEFIGVTPQGWDKYLVHHKNGTEEVGFSLDSNGTLAGAFRRP